MRRECRERFPRYRGLAIPAGITARAWLAVSFEVSGEENVPGIPGACATHNFTYLVRSPCYTKRNVLIKITIILPGSVESILRQQ